jgi:hypothetical protein
MQIDINEVFANMAGAVKNEVKSDWKIVKSTVNDFLESRKNRIELLVSFRLQNQISGDFFQQRLADEKDILESELHAIAIINKVTAQNAANAAIGVLQKAVDTALHIV